MLLGSISAIFSCSHEPSTISAAKALLGFIEEDSLRSLYPSEYVKWVQDEANGLRKEKTIDELLFSVQFKPYDYIICEEEKNDTINKHIRNNKISELNDMEYYDLRITIKDSQGELLKYNLSGVAEYNERVNYFAFQMQKDISLIQNGDTIPCGLYHFERAFDTSPSSTILLGFKKIKGRKSTEEKTIVFHDKIFDKGIIKFTFDSKELTNIPKLRTI